MAKTSANYKLCIKCNRSLPLSEFYPNKKWAAQSYHDAWCKECAQRYCTDQESLKQYCFENNRKWEDSYWDSSYKKAQYYLSNNPLYVNPKTPTEKKKAIVDEATCRQFFTLMNMKSFYTYLDNVKTNDVFEAQKIEERDTKMEYSKVWRGYFTKDQIAILDATYEEYERDFDLGNVSVRDYARKVAKASLNADIAEDKMRRGEISASEYNEVQKIFDNLSKSSNFAACARKPGSSTGLTSLGNIIYNLEINHQLDINPFIFPEDDIDKVMADYRHVAVAVGVQI